LKPVDYVIIFYEPTPTELIKTIRPDIHVKGGDYTADQLPERDIVMECGGRVVVVGVTRGRSTTNIVSKIKDSEENGGE
jgi:glycerol-3-phosphate cytidylyltransferase